MSQLEIKGKARFVGLNAESKDELAFGLKETVAAYVFGGQEPEAVDFHNAIDALISTIMEVMGWEETRSTPS